jgi:hypothetical protein
MWMADYWVSLTLRDPNDLEDVLGLAATLIRAGPEGGLAGPGADLCYSSRGPMTPGKICFPC